jgi:MFS family permease
MRDPPAETVYRDRDLSVYLGARALSNVASLVQSVAIGWQVYDLTRTPLSLGLVGLAEFVPMFLLTLPAGEMADRLDPRGVLVASLLLEALCSGLLLVLALLRTTQTWPLYIALMLFGCARGFAGPATRTVLAFLVPPVRLPAAIAWSSSVAQIATIAGPAIGGFIYALGAGAAYTACALGFLASAVGTATLRGRRAPIDATRLGGRIERVREGVHFVRSRPVILGAISLDLFAVLLGGSIALLPIYARDILHVGPSGLGMLRSAPAIGAAAVALYLTRHPIERRIGVRMFAAVAVFGVGTIVFGLSRSFVLSLLSLVVLGVSDQISVFVRTALVQFATPDEMRGRVSAVSSLFIGASNELGEFESGITAALLGTVPAVVVGGVGTLIVVLVWMRLFPALRTVDRLTDVSVIG